MDIEARLVAIKKIRIMPFKLMTNREPLKKGIMPLEEVREPTGWFQRYLKRQAVRQYVILYPLLMKGQERESMLRVKDRGRFLAKPTDGRQMIRCLISKSLLFW
jgi:hypothetical protein